MLAEKTRDVARHLVSAPCDADIDHEVEQAARSAEGVFESRAELAAWLSCAFSRCGSGGQSACGELAAAACAVRFGGMCARSSRPAQFIDLVGRLPTRRLEALLALRSNRTV